MQRTLPRRVVFARRLRRRPTVSEATLWHLLRRHQIDGFLFRRQFPVGPYFADFFCMQARFAIEIDGASHLGRSRRDRLRDTFFRRRGILVLRLPDTLVIKHPEHALTLIRAAIHIWRPRFASE